MTIDRRAISISIIGLVLFSGCETPPPQVNSAIPMSWGESSVLQLSPESELSAAQWRKIVVLTRGVLTIGLQSTINSGQIKLNVRNQDGRRTVFQKQIDLAPKSPANATLSVGAGTYYISLEPVGAANLNVAMAARFKPQDPDAFSGSDKDREGAQVLINSQPKEGAVSYRDGNRTDWFKYEVADSESLLLQFKPLDQARGVRAECITPSGQIFELKGADKLVVREPANVWIRVYADQADSGGGYRLTAASLPSMENERKGMILKYNSDSATINLGTEDGVREGLKGFVQRPDGSSVDFVIEKALRRTSNAKAKAVFSENDLNLQVQFDRK